MKNERIIVFAPHPDDETLGCGGTIAKKISEGHEVKVVVMTDGRNAFRNTFGIDSDPPPMEVREMRKKELERAMNVLNVQKENVLLLDFEDGTLEKCEKKAETIVTEIIARNHPDEVYSAYENDYNLDHRATFRIVKNSIRKCRMPKSVYQYSIYRKYSRINPVLDAFANLWKHNLVYTDISDFLNLKAKALKEYESQVTVISSRQPRPVVASLDRFLKKNEVFFVYKIKNN